MPISVPAPLIEFFLLGPTDDRRQLQDSPILGDAWIQFGKKPGARHDLLISPCSTRHAGDVANAISGDLKDVDANIAYLQGFVIATLSFEELVRFVVPKTQWWMDKYASVANAPNTQENFTRQHEVEKDYYVSDGLAKLTSMLAHIINSAICWRREVDQSTDEEETFTTEHPEAAFTAEQQPDCLPNPLDRFIALTGIILWAGDQQAATSSSDARALMREILEKASLEIDKIADRLLTLSNEMLKSDGESEPIVWQVSLNRAALPALAKSVPAVKGDAANTLFKVNCSEITWAVLDSGIDGNHPAFREATGQFSRVKRSFDFKNFRKIVSLSNIKEHVRQTNVEALMRNRASLVDPPDNPDGALKQLAEDACERRPPHWELVEKFVEIKPHTPPPTNHGTHVAGIIGANKKAAKKFLGKDEDENEPANTTNFADGMCPDISLYDFRVLGPDLKQTEFAIIAALQFIRYLNDRDNFFSIHGANLSLSILHDVRNYACGATPICNECERLVNSGVVVVAAAGNHGYKSYETKEGLYDSYAAFSITDPGNADGVITVGATHRYWPHTYGVSFFSSRGPTGDGRLKPDLVAPGERIRAPFPGGHKEGGAWGDLDGTSMAAPHVSGAAAMLLARYSELIGQPRRVKRVLCETATDLGRERNFQGHGMLDVLRAFQSI
jgi:hypothetical protein